LSRRVFAGLVAGYFQFLNGKPLLSRAEEGIYHNQKNPEGISNDLGAN